MCVCGAHVHLNYVIVHVCVNNGYEMQCVLFYGTWPL
jgi:hypothetical protein